MSAVERITDGVSETVAGPLKGMWTGVKAGGMAGIILGALVGIAAGIFLMGMFAPVGVGILAFAQGHMVAATLVAGAGALAGASVGGFKGAILGFQAGGILGLFKGIFKGIKSLFSGRDTEIRQMEQDVQMLRETRQAVEADIRAAGPTTPQELKQQRIEVMQNANPDAPDNNRERLQVRRSAPAVPTPPMTI